MNPLRHAVHVPRPVASPATREDGVALVELLTRQLLARIRLAVVYGGDKTTDGAVIRPTRNPRSWKSYESVARDIAAAMTRLGCAHVEVMPDDMTLPQRLKDRRIHLAWLNTGGVQGHAAIAHAAAMLEMLGIPYIGHDPLTAAALDNKFFFKRQMQAIGVPTAPFIVWTPTAGAPDLSQDPRFVLALRDANDGFIVKPVTGRASLHVYHVGRLEQLAETAAKVHAITHNPVIIEAFLPGREYCIAVTGPIIARAGRLQRLPGPFSFAAVERVLESGEHVFTSMDTKPITRERMRPLDPARDAFVIDTLEDLATRIYTELPLKTLVRLDVRADRHGKLHVLEANPKPDLKAADATSTSLIEAGLERYGMTYDDLILSIFANRAAELLDEASGITESIENLIAR